MRAHFLSEVDEFQNIVFNALAIETNQSKTIMKAKVYKITFQSFYLKKLSIFLGANEMHKYSLIILT
jgi:hypothetical protein